MLEEISIKQIFGIKDHDHFASIREINLDSLIHE